MKNEYLIEVTDTYAGEANYCWVKRYKVKAASVRGAITALAKHNGDKGWRFDYGDNMGARYNLTGATVCAFVDFYDELAHEDIAATEIN